MEPKGYKFALVEEIEKALGGAGSPELCGEILRVVDKYRKGESAEQWIDLRSECEALLAQLISKQGHSDEYPGLGVWKRRCTILTADRIELSAERDRLRDERNQLKRQNVAANQALADALKRVAELEKENAARCHCHRMMTK